MTKSDSKTVKQQSKKAIPKGLKPFKPNNKETGEVDPRINRKGRPPIPKNQQELNDVIDKILAEEVNISGQTMDKLRMAINRLLFSKQPAGQIHILDRRYGKVPQPLLEKLSGTVNVRFVDETTKTEEDDGDD